MGMACLARRALCWVVSGTVHLVVALYGWLPPLFGADLPDVWTQRIVCLCWPEPAHEPLYLFVGESEREVRSFLGDARPFSTEGPYSGCVRYWYQTGWSVRIEFQRGYVTALSLAPERGNEGCLNRVVQTLVQ